ncbi:MAG: hypothetical protein WC785_05600 [Tatlockia sp.]
MRKTANNKGKVQTINNTSPHVPQNISFLDLFGNQVKKRPNAVALGCEHQLLTYKALDEKPIKWRIILFNRGLNHGIL